MSGNHSVRNVEAEAGSDADGLGGKEGLKDLAAMFWSYAWALIDDSNTDPLALDPGADYDFSLLRRCVDGVVQEVCPDLADAGAAGSEDGDLSTELLLDRDLFLAEFVAEDGKSAVDGVVDIELMLLILVFVSVFLDRHHQFGDSGNAFFDGSDQLDVRDQGFESIQRIGKHI